MKWGIRKSRRSSSGRVSKNSSKKSNKKQSSSSSNKSGHKTNNPKKMSEQELRSKISRLQLEKQYRDLKYDQMSDGKKIVSSIAKQTIKNVGIQAGTKYGMMAIDYAAAKLFGVDSSNKKKVKN